MFELIKQKRLQALIVSDKINIKYLSWFVWQYAFLIYLKKKKYLITDLRYFHREKNRQKNEKLWFEVLNVSQDKWIKILENRIIWIESDNITLEKFKILKSKIKWAKFKKLNNICLNLRIIKSKKEIEIMKKAADIASNALKKVIPKIKVWISERKLAYLIEKQSRENGASAMSCDSVVAFWEWSSYPHHLTWDRLLKKWDIILIDFWVMYKSYASDMTRTFFTWSNKKQEQTYDIVLKAQTTALNLLKPWVKISYFCNKVDDYLKSKWLSKHFTHALWHWVWMEIHENPHVYSKEKTLLEEWMVITIEPWLYFTGDYWIRIEDSIVVTKNWFENLSLFPKDKIYLDI